MTEFNPVQKSIETENGRIFYFADNFFAGKPTVVFVHGLSSNHTTWLNIMKKIHAHGYSSLALELRGHGLSDKRKKRSLYRLEVFTEDLNRIITVEKIKEIILVGYSYGGSIAIDYAVKHPEFLKGLVLMSANHVCPWAYRRIKAFIWPAYWFLNALAFLLLWQKRKKYYYYEQGKSKGYWHSVWIGLNTMPLSVNFWILSETANVGFRESIKNIKAPTLIVRAENDPFLTQAEALDMAKALPNGKILNPKHPSHFLASRAQEEMSQIILDFIKGIYQE